MNMSTTDKLITDSGSSNGRLIERSERTRTAHLAHHLSSVALRQSERALTGIVAVPAALALGVAASATYGVAMIERVFEVFESAIGEIGRTIEQSSSHLRNMDRPEMRP
jgi:hypothetical protein